MGDLLKNMRSSQIFSVCGLPEVKVHKAKPDETDGAAALPGRAGRPRRVRPGDDGDRASRAATTCRLVARHRLQRPVLPRLAGVLPAHRRLGRPQEGAQGRLRRHACGTTWPARRSAPFEAGEHGQVAVKVIDDRGNELLVVTDSWAHERTSPTLRPDSHAVPLAPRPGAMCPRLVHMKAISISRHCTWTTADGGCAQPRRKAVPSWSPTRPTGSTASQPFDDRGGGAAAARNREAAIRKRLRRARSIRPSIRRRPATTRCTSTSASIA